MVMLSYLDTLYTAILSPILCHLQGIQNLYVKLEDLCKTMLAYPCTAIHVHGQTKVREKMKKDHSIRRASMQQALKAWLDKRTKSITKMDR